MRHFKINHLELIDVYAQKMRHDAYSCKNHNMETDFLVQENNADLMASADD